MLALLLVVALGFWALGFYWSREPTVLWVVRETPEGHRAVVGYSTVNTLIDAIDWMLDKPGGYLSNDVLPPGVWLDNMPSFEFGVLTQCRDLARVLRNYYSRSQSQSLEDDDLAIAEPALNTDNRSWLLPPAESKYREAANALRRYRDATDRRHTRQRAVLRARRQPARVARGRRAAARQSLAAALGQCRPDSREHGFERRARGRSFEQGPRRRDRQDAVAARSTTNSTKRAAPRGHC